MTHNMYPLFSVYGIEIEYMIVDRDSLDIMPIADKLIENIAGKITNEFEIGEIAISNELALHAIELKTNGPRSGIDGLDAEFTQVIDRLNGILQTWNAMLLPTGMHPWYAPSVDIKLWPHGDQEIYNAYHKIFNCSGHGWANVQSIHLNLPFSNEVDFVDLHSAIRLVLPIIPALTASTPYCEGKYLGVLDARLLYYGTNQRIVPSISGNIIPEFIASFDAYHQMILEPMYRDISKFSDSDILKNEWLNSRGAIARFDRYAIEIRIMDSQECASADMACASLISELLKYMIKNGSECKTSYIGEDVLRKQYDLCLTHGLSAEIVDDRILRQLHMSQKDIKTVRDLWSKIYLTLSCDIAVEYHAAIEHILNFGNLATRIRDACAPDDAIHKQKLTYMKLSQCLALNEVFTP